MGADQAAHQASEQELLFSGNSQLLELAKKNDGIKSFKILHVEYFSFLDVQIEIHKKDGSVTVLNYPKDKDAVDSNLINYVKIAMPNVGDEVTIPEPTNFLTGAESEMTDAGESPDSIQKTISDFRRKRDEDQTPKTDDNDSNSIVESRTLDSREFENVLPTAIIESLHNEYSNKQIAYVLIDNERVSESTDENGLNLLINNFIKSYKEEAKKITLTARQTDSVVKIDCLVIDQQDGKHHFVIGLNEKDSTDQSAADGTVAEPDGQLEGEEVTDMSIGVRDKLLDRFNFFEVWTLLDKLEQRPKAAIIYNEDGSIVDGNVIKDPKLSDYGGYLNTLVNQIKNDLKKRSFKLNSDERLIIRSSLYQTNQQLVLDISVHSATLVDSFTKSINEDSVSKPLIDGYLRIVFIDEDEVEERRAQIDEVRKQREQQAEIDSVIEAIRNKHLVQQDEVSKILKILGAEQEIRTQAVTQTREITTDLFYTMLSRFKGDGEASLENALATYQFCNEILGANEKLKAPESLVFWGYDPNYFAGKDVTFFDGIDKEFDSAAENALQKCLEDMMDQIAQATLAKEAEVGTNRVKDVILEMLQNSIKPESKLSKPKGNVFSRFISGIGRAKREDYNFSETMKALMEIIHIDDVNFPKDEAGVIQIESKQNRLIELSEAVMLRRELTERRAKLVEEIIKIMNKLRSGDTREFPFDPINTKITWLSDLFLEEKDEIGNPIRIKFRSLDSASKLIKVKSHIESKLKAFDQIYSLHDDQLELKSDYEKLLKLISGQPKNTSDIDSFSLEYVENKIEVPFPVDTGTTKFTSLIEAAKQVLGKPAAQTQRFGSFMAAVSAPTPDVLELAKRFAVYPDVAQMDEIEEILSKLGDTLKVDATGFDLDGFLDQNPRFLLELFQGILRLETKEIKTMRMQYDRVREKLTELFPKVMAERAEKAKKEADAKAKVEGVKQVKQKKSRNRKVINNQEGQGTSSLTDINKRFDDLVTVGKLDEAYILIRDEKGRYTDTSEVKRIIDKARNANNIAFAQAVSNLFIQSP